MNVPKNYILVVGLVIFITCTNQNCKAGTVVECPNLPITPYPPVQQPNSLGTVQPSVPCQTTSPPNMCQTTCVQNSPINPCQTTCGQAPPVNPCQNSPCPTKPTNPCPSVCCQNQPVCQCQTPPANPCQNIPCPTTPTNTCPSVCCQNQPVCQCQTVCGQTLPANPCQNTPCPITPTNTCPTGCCQNQPVCQCQAVCGQTPPANPCQNTPCPITPTNTCPTGCCQNQPACPSPERPCETTTGAPPPPPPPPPTFSTSTTTSPPTTTFPPSNITLCPPGTILIGDMCHIIYCPLGTVMKNDRCVFIACPEGTIWTGHRCSVPEPIVHNFSFNHTITTYVNQTTPDIIINNTKNIVVNAPVTINEHTADNVNCNNDYEDCDKEDVTTAPTTDTTQSCCEVMTPRICEERNNRWHCYSRRSRRCGDFCIAPIIYLKPPRIYARPKHVIMPPLQRECESYGTCGSMTGGHDCSGCSMNNMSRCSYYCYRYSCPSQKCNFFDQKEYCASNRFSMFGCQITDGCYDDWCLSN